MRHTCTKSGTAPHNFTRVSLLRCLCVLDTPSLQPVLPVKFCATVAPSAGVMQAPVNTVQAVIAHGCHYGSLPKKPGPVLLDIIPAACPKDMTGAAGQPHDMHAVMVCRHPCPHPPCPTTSASTAAMAPNRYILKGLDTSSSADEATTAAACRAATGSSSVFDRLPLLPAAPLLEPASDCSPSRSGS
jgi:hypothetical protein